VTGVQTCALPISPKPQNPFIYDETTVMNILYINAHQHF